MDVMMDATDRPWGRLTIHARARLPLHENVLDRLAELLFETDELLDVVRAADAKTLQWTEPHLQQVYDNVNGLMKKLSD